MTVKRARQLRKTQTDVERKLWSLLRGRQFEGLKFRRQVPIGPYVADFACFDAKLIVELDGGQHGLQTKRDAARTARLAKNGFRVLRFWNTEFIENPEGVMTAIAYALGVEWAVTPHPASRNRVPR